jgi:hypothetical protein
VTQADVRRTLRDRALHDQPWQTMRQIADDLGATLPRLNATLYQLLHVGEVEARPWNGRLHAYRLVRL